MGVDRVNNPGVRKRLFAWILKKGDGINHRIYGSVKKDLLKNASGIVLEIGPGTGVNFSYLPRDIEWMGIEPNEAFHKTLLTKAKDKGIKARLISGMNSLADNSVDTILATLVLCSVRNPIKIIAEIKRVLRPNGRFIFIEHVASSSSKGLLLAQNISNPFNRLAADGCNCNRRTWDYIQQGGFSEVHLKHYDMKGTMIIHRPHIVGYAIK